MDLDEIVNKAIPFLEKDCRLVRAAKEHKRQVLKDRIIKYCNEQKQKPD